MMDRPANADIEDNGANEDIGMQDELNALLDQLAIANQTTGLTNFIPNEQVPDAHELISVLVASDMSLRLTSEKLKVPTAQIVAKIVADPSSPAILAQQLRTYAMLGMATSLAKAQTSFIQALPNLSPYDASKTYTTLIAQVLAATNPNEGMTTNINVTEVIMRMMPPEAREALKQLSQEPLAVQSQVVSPHSDGHD